MSWARKDNRVVTETITEGGLYNIQLQASGHEPLLMYNNGADIEIGYNRGGPYITIPDGYQYTWEYCHPFGAEFYVKAHSTTASTLTFMIGGAITS